MAGPGRWPSRVWPHRADADHIIEYVQGGKTIDVDLAPACRHDHLLRHDGLWTVHQPTPGVVVWTSPFGQAPPPQPRHHPAIDSDEEFPF